MRTVYADGDIAMLQEPIQLDLNLNDLRMIVNSMKAVEYQTSIDDVTYLDNDTRALKKRLEGTRTDNRRAGESPGSAARAYSGVGRPPALLTLSKAPTTSGSN
jgi:hypothetical protein